MAGVYLFWQLLIYFAVERMSAINVTKNNTYTGHSDCVYTLEKGPESNSFFSSGGDGMVVLWDLNSHENGRLIAKVNTSVYALHYDPSDDLLIVGQNYEGIHLVRVAEKEAIGSLKTGNHLIFDIKKHGQRIFVAMAGGLVKVIDAKELATIKDIELSRESARCIAINEKLDHFAVGYSDNSIRIFDLQSYELLHTLEGSLNSVFAVVYSPENEILLSGGRDARLRIWDTRNAYMEVEVINAHMYALNHIAFSPNANNFVTCSMDKSIKVWDAKSFKLLKVIDKSRHAGHGTSVNKLLWSDYKNQVISGSDDHSISVWNLEFN